MAIVTNTTPTGVVLPYAGGTIPNGWMLCDGSIISRSQYPSLFAAIGTIYGAGDGSTTFSLPDYRYSFLRGRGTTLEATSYSSVSRAVSFTDATDLVTLTAHYLTNGTKIQFKTIATTTGISINTDYYVIVVSNNTFKLSSTLNGPALPLTNDGGGILKDIATFPNHGLNRTGIKVRYKTSPPTGLSINEDYYAIIINENNLAFASTYNNAVQNVRIVISGADSGSVITQSEDLDVSLRGLSSPGGQSGIGSRQLDQMQGHIHYRNQSQVIEVIGTPGGGGYGITGGSSSFLSNNNDKTGNPLTDTTNGTPRTGVETRPSNIYVNYIIKV